MIEVVMAKIGNPIKTDEQKKRFRDLLDQIGSHLEAAKMAGVSRQSVDSWYKNPEIVSYEKLTGLCSGLASQPELADKVLRELAEDEMRRLGIADADTEILAIFARWWVLATPDAPSAYDQFTERKRDGSTAIVGMYVAALYNSAPPYERRLLKETALAMMEHLSDDLEWRQRYRLCINELADYQFSEIITAPDTDKRVVSIPDAIAALTSS